MKNSIYKIVLATIFLFGITKASAQERNVIWVHGLNDNANAWEHYNQIFDKERNLNSLRANYSTDNGITPSSNQVVNSINFRYQGDANNPQNLGIGHSMGGLMIRDADRNTISGSKKFGGYITVDAPNYGAPISNSLLDGSVERAAQDACNKLVDGPASQLFSLPWGIVSNLATNTLCDIFINNDLFKDYIGSPITANDLKVGSTTINAINNNNTNTPRISIWAEENSPVHWRMISSTLYNNDVKFVNIVNAARGVYNGFYIYNTSLAVVSGVFGFWNPFAWGATALCSYRASQWRKGRNWIDDSENIWSTLIKTTRQEPQTYLVNVWKPCPYPPEKPIMDKSIITNQKRIDPNCGQWQWEQRTRYISVNYPSDGLLPQYTQELQGISGDNRYKIEGANHLEVLDMSQSTLNGVPNDGTRRTFNAIFDRKDWFNTPK